MMSNNDSIWKFNKTSINGVENLPFLILFIVNFFVIGSGNILLALSILRYKALRSRKEYVILLGLFLADSLSLTAYLAAGIDRIIVILNGNYCTYIKTWQCVKTVYTLIWSVAEPLQSVMLVVVSLDRLIAVAIPYKYMILGLNYALIMVISAFTYCLMVAALGIGLIFIKRNHTETVTLASCYMDHVMQHAGHVYHIYFIYATPCFAVISILVYGAVLVTHWCKTRKTIGQNVTRGPRERKRQRKLTVSLGISSLCTLVFQVIPVGLGYTIRLLDGSASLALAFFTISMLNPFCNVLIYTKRHGELRLAVRGFITCKKMPRNLKVWKAKINEVKCSKERNQIELSELNVEKLHSVVPEERLNECEDEV